MLKKFLIKPWSAIMIAIFCSILWGSAFPVLKVSYVELQMAPNDVMAKMVFAGIRFLIAGIIVLVLLAFMDIRKLKITKRQLLVLTLLGIIQTALQYYFFYNGLAIVSGMQGAILSSSGIFFTVLLAHFYYNNDRLDRKKWLGIIAGFIGIVLANWGQSFAISFQWNGEGYMILAGLTSAIATIMAKELATGIHPFAITGWQLTIGAILLLLVGYPQLQEGSIVFTPLGWGLLLYSALLSAIAFGLWYSLLKYQAAGKISMYKFIVPVAGVLFSAMFIDGEALNVMIFGAIVMVASGIIVVNYRS
ncbi:DMT family transporter [Gracilibacillus dipsosauri]|uniref:EamA/RhaT family transporter n=1 Tax=Gracilibacillus dipsosauri TaxID=178340 RepID=A0A317L253_9BACI|nr:DMT family transporter [Gracilibacillus dipsosauri]PWU69603.1 EamA/RhaT family transporter [Gracilibacillus dipsosauri]